MYLDERFKFRGIDSGIALDLEDYQSDAGQLPSGGGGGGGGGGQTDVLDTRFGDTTGDIVTRADPNSPDTLFQTLLQSSTQSHLFGPTAGLRYELGGGKKFSIWGETVVGLLVNFEQTKVDSENFVEQSHSKTVYGLDPLAEEDGTPRPADFNRHSDEESHVHVSPMFKQGLHGELGLAMLFPKLRNNPFIEEGFITAGYTVTVLGYVQRPGEGYNARGVHR